MMVMKIMMMMIITINEAAMSRKRLSAKFVMPIKIADTDGGIGRPLLGDRICVYLNVPRHGRAYTIFAFAQYLQTLEGIAAIRPGSGTGVVHLLVGDFLEVASVYVAK